MTTTVGEIRSWLTDAKKDGYTHVAIVCDTFDYEDYPVSIFATTEEDVRKHVAAASSGKMQKLMEVYALHLDFESQLSEPRAHHYEVAEQPAITETDAQFLSRVYGVPVERFMLTPPGTQPDVDHCGGACNNAITIWLNDVCDCCGRQWGHDNGGPCHDMHIEGDVWVKLLWDGEPRKLAGQ